MEEKSGNYISAIRNLPTVEKKHLREPIITTREINPSLSGYIFRLQESVEGQGVTGMDYGVFARRMWEELIGRPKQGGTEPGKGIRVFEESLVAGLHSINMQPLVYEAIENNSSFNRKILSQYAAEIGHLALWTAGNVNYQVAKIRSTGVVRQFYHQLRVKLGNQEAKEFMDKKTSLIVEDHKKDVNKFTRLRTFVESSLRPGDERKMNYSAAKLTGYPSESSSVNHSSSQQAARYSGSRIKVVVVEDSRKNLEKVKETLRDLADRVEFVPIWAAYNREGNSATRSEFENDLKRFNGIRAFGELLDQERFGETFRDAMVFLDFDGVVVNNERMRERQAEVIVSSLVWGEIAQYGGDAKSILGRLNKKAAGLINQKVQMD